MFEVGDMVISIMGCGFGFVVETKNKDNYAICFFKQPDRVRWYQGNELQGWGASDV